MNFDPNNNIVQCCVEGMKMEGEGHLEMAAQLFEQAWASSTNDFEKFLPAHYVARHQQDIESKLKWDQIALDFALKARDEGVEVYYPSLYLNIAKCYEDLNDPAKATAFYKTAQSYQHFLPNDGYGNMIRQGILNGLERTGNL